MLARSSSDQRVSPKEREAERRCSESCRAVVLLRPTTPRVPAAAERPWPRGLAGPVLGPL